MSLVIAPSVLAADFGRFSEEARAVYEAKAEWLHLDIMDGVFVPNISFGPETVRAIRSSTPAVLDVHLMIDDPDRYAPAFAAAGADRITVHVEAGPHLHRSLGVIKSLGLKAGVALNPGTPETAIAPVLDAIDLVLVMSVNPGFGGQLFISSSIEKIARVRTMVGHRSVDISVDGGVTASNAGAIKEAGATVLVAGSAVFRGGSPAYAGNIEALRRAV